MKNVTLFDGSLVARHLRGGIDVESEPQHGFFDFVEKLIFEPIFPKALKEQQKLSGTARLRAWSASLR